MAKSNGVFKKQYGKIKANINILLNSDMGGLALLSPAGLGKTTMIMNSLKENNYKEGTDYLYYNSYFTPLAFFRALQETNELSGQKIMFLDDVEGILRNKDIINLIKAATWNNNGDERVITYMSTSDKVKDPICKFKGKIIILINEIPESNPMFNAILDRILFCELNFNQSEVFDLIEDEILPKPYKTLTGKQRGDIFRHIKKCAKPESEISFRTLIKGYNFALFAPHHWKELVRDMLKSGNREIPKNSLI